MGIFDGFLQQLGTGDQIRDVKHASRLYVDNNYALSPKFDWLYHVYFDLDPSLTKVNRDKVIEAGMLVKSVDLPKFTIDTKTYNNYNRPEVVQTKLKYDTIQIVFHDDQSDVVRGLWFDYFNHYYRDMDTSFSDGTGTVNPTYHANQKYRLGQRDQLNKFGYSPRNDAGINGPQYMQSIRIYSLHQKRFSAYTLVNPTIVAFSHGNHNASSNGSLEHTMTIAYTTMLYASGHVTQATVKGFADLHYDKSPSPLTVAGGGTNSILGPGGILSAADQVIQDGFAGNYGSAAFKLFRGFQKNKNVDLKGLAAAELASAGMDILNGKDPRDRFFVPYSGGLANGPGGSAQTNAGLGTAAAGSVSSNGSSLNLGTAAVIGGTALALSGKPTLGAGVAIAGLLLNSSGQITGGSLDKTVNIDKTSTTGNASSNAAIASSFLSAISSSSPLNFLSFGGALLKVSQERAAKAKAEEVKKQQEEKAIATAMAPTNAGILTAIQSGAVQSGVPSYQSGTNSSIVGAVTGSPLQQTPYASTITTAQPAVAGAEANQYIQNGNPQKFAGGYGNFTSTNPAPDSGTTI